MTALAVFMPADATALFGGNEGKQVLSYITRQGYGNREYLADGIWIPEPKGTVTGSRYNVESISMQLGEIAGAWKYVKERSMQPPEKPDKVLEQLSMARLKPEPLRLFSPWGPRYKKASPRIEKGDPELMTLDEIKEIFAVFGENGYDIDFLLMPADTYGTEINSLPAGFVSEYFKWLEECACTELGNVTVKPWSVIREEQRSLYDKLRAEIDKNFSEFVGDGEYRRAVNVAKRFSPKSEESSRQYCIERLVEGNIISAAYDPIKLSIVRKEKDSLDGPLRRIYVVANRAPWLGR